MKELGKHLGSLPPVPKQAPLLGATLTDEDGQRWIVLGRYPWMDTGSEVGMTLCKIPDGETAHTHGRTWHSGGALILRPQEELKTLG